METEIRPLPKFEYFAPGSLSNIVALLQEYGEGAALLAGGTDLLSNIKRLSRSPNVIVDLSRVPALSFIEIKKDALHIGAATVLNEIKKSPVVQERAPVLAEAIGVLASNPIRNRATIGGNLCNASPAADTAPPLLALDASLTLLGPDSERTVAISEFFRDPGQTVRRADEIVKEIIIPFKKGRSTFLKLGRRKGFTLSIASVAAFGVITDGRFEDLRVALGAVAPTPVRCRKVEEALRGVAAKEEGIEKAARLVNEEVNPITDVRASAAYRKEMSYVLTKRALKKIAMGEDSHGGGVK